MADPTTTLTQVQAHILNPLSPPLPNPVSTPDAPAAVSPLSFLTPILLGHSLESDLKALKISPGFSELKVDHESIFEHMSRSTRRSSATVRSAVGVGYVLFVSHKHPDVPHINQSLRTAATSVWAMNNSKPRSHGRVSLKWLSTMQIVFSASDNRWRCSLLRNMRSTSQFAKEALTSKRSHSSTPLNCLIASHYSAHSSWCSGWPQFRLIKSLFANNSRLLAVALYRPQPFGDSQDPTTGAAIDSDAMQATKFMCLQ
ncbi:hypothetical protein JOM56_013772 [Amanita muscaria]